MTDEELQKIKEYKDNATRYSAITWIPASVMADIDFYKQSINSLIVEVERLHQEVIRLENEYQKCPECPM